MAHTTSFFSPSSTAAAQFLLLLRSIQHTSLVLSAFICLYFIYWHNILKDPIPNGLIAFAISCSVAFLGNYCYAAIVLLIRETNINHHTLLSTNGPCAFAIAVGYRALRSVPFLEKWNEGDNWFRPIRESEGLKLLPAGVEEHQSLLAFVLMAAGTVALSATILISVFAGVGLWMNKKLGSPRGYAMVGEATDIYDGESVFEEEDVEKLS